MGQFRDKSLQLLIATDVAARGIDVAGISHVINYELPAATEEVLKKVLDEIENFEFENAFNLLK